VCLSQCECVSQCVCVLLYMCAGTPARCEMRLEGLSPFVAG